MVPFRKCQSMVEERIVSIINKIESGRFCEKQLRSLNEKLRRLPMRQLMNRYVMSGVNIVCKLTKKQDVRIKIASDISEILETTYESMQKRIYKELDNIENFQVQKRQDWVNFDYEERYKEKVVRKLYRLLKMRKGMKNSEDLKK